MKDPPMQRFTSWAEIEPTATEAEKELKASLATGRFCKLEDGGLPDTPDAGTIPASKRHVRADVLRYFLLGGCNECPVTELGVGLGGAFVTGRLSLTDCNITGNIFFHSCRFQNGIKAIRCNARKSFRLRACKLPSLDASSLKVGGQFSCNGTEFLNKGHKALNLQGATIGQGFFFRGNASVQGWVNLTAAACGDLSDDPSCWPDGGKVLLDGFTYGRIHGPTDARTRLDWLARGDRLNEKFFPQPYKQLAKVLDDMGHEADAREVLYTLARKLGEQRRKELRQEIAKAGQASPGIGLAIAKRLLLAGEHVAGALLRLVVGYGYKPFRSLAVLTSLIAAFWIATIGTWHAGDFAPNSAVMLQHADWTALPLEGNAAKKWTEETPTGRDWESFHSLAYAADVVIPIIEFGQTDAWAPSPERGWWGKHLWWLRWVFTTLGWIVTALGAAALTGIIRRN